MSWVLQDADDRAILTEIAGQSDRGVILIAASLLERRLEQTIAIFFDPDPDPDLYGKILKGWGPLSSFSAKIDVGRLLQLYPDSLHKILHKIRELRNDAAHELTAISFTLPSVKTRCENFQPMLMQVTSEILEHNMQWVRARRHIPNPEDRADVRYEDGHESPYFSFQLDKERDAKGLYLAVIQIALFHLYNTRQILESTRDVLLPLRDKS